MTFPALNRSDIQAIIAPLVNDLDASLAIGSLGTNVFENKQRGIIAVCCILPFRDLDAPGPQWPQDHIPQSHNAWFHLLASNSPVNFKAIIRATLTDGRFFFPLNVYARIANQRLWPVMKRVYGAQSCADYPHICHARIADAGKL